MTDTPDPDAQRGLYRKYELHRVSENGGRRYQVTDPFFVLRYTTDPHASAALLAYADACEADSPQLATDLRQAVGPRVLTAKDFEWRYDDTHVYPFFETENADWVIGYGHGDKAAFAAAVDDYDRYAGELGPDETGYTADEVAHLWAVVDDKDAERITANNRRATAMSAEDSTLQWLEYEASAYGEIYSISTDSIEIRGIDIEVDAGGMSVTTTQSATGKVNDSIAAVHQGEYRKAALSARRLLQALSVIEDAEVTLGFRETGHLVGIHPGPLDRTDDPVELLACENFALLIGISGRN